MSVDVRSVSAAPTRLRAPWSIVARAAVVPRRLSWPHAPLAAIAALAAFLGLFRIGREGYANTYYAAAVKSMLDNRHAFFFVSFDSGGFVTVDKPPLGLWVQAAFAWVLGFHGWSILLPQALASVGSVLILYHLVGRVFGPVAGLLAALALAVAPINVAASRNNTADCVLVFVLLLATWAVSRSLERGSVRWFCVGMALVGLGFNIKMLQAYLVLPALLLAWFLTPACERAGEVDPGAEAVMVVATRRSVRNRFGGLIAGAVVLLFVSFSWATIVQLTPADQRPYIGSSANNSIFNLIFGYNGLNRLLPRGWSILGITNGSTTALGGGPGGGGGVGGVSENGPAGIFRLIDTELGGQVGWLLPMALIGLVAAWGRHRWWRMDRVRLALVVWGGWLLTQATFFSIAGFYHRYYLSMLWPAVAALAGIGVVALWRSYRAGGWRTWLLPTALGASAAVQIKILNDYPTWRDRLVPAIAGLAAVSCLGLLVGSLLRLRRLRLGRVGIGLAAAGVLALLIAPATWSGITVADASSNAVLPVAGPAGAGDGIGFGGRSGGFGSFGPGQTLPNGEAAGRPSGASDGERPTFTEGQRGQVGQNGPGELGKADSGLIAYLLANQGKATYLVAVQSASQASSIILQTDKAVMAMGGFTGSDPILTVDSFKHLLADGKVRFILGGGFGGRGGGFGRGQTGVDTWVRQSCAVVPASGYAAGSSIGDNQTLYDCQNAVTS
jgi:4-amino-4-deoxy-L-arabinose transferase-like glycosyltransferase